MNQTDRIDQMNQIDRIDQMNQIDQIRLEACIPLL